MDGKSYNDTVDQWCLGILCYEFLVGKPPFESENNELTYEKIRRIEIFYPTFMSSGSKDLISRVSFFTFKCKKLFSSLIHNVFTVIAEGLQRSDPTRPSYATSMGQIVREIVIYCCLNLQCWTRNRFVSTIIIAWCIICLFIFFVYNVHYYIGYYTNISKM